MRYLLLVIIFIISFLGIWLGIYHFKGYSIIPGSHYPIFSDLMTLTYSVDSINSGLNPYFDTSLDPLLRTYNYPKIWLDLFKFLNISGQNTFKSGICLIEFFMEIWYIC